MYARVARFEGGDPGKADPIIEGVRKMVQSQEPPPGVKKFIMLVDRETGHALGVSFFEDEQKLRAAEPFFERQQSPAPEAGGRRTAVNVYEVAVEHEL